MTYIKVDAGKLSHCNDIVQAAMKNVINIKSEFSDIADALDWDIKSASNIRRKLNNIENEMEKEITCSTRLHSFIETALGMYQNVNTKIIDYSDSNMKKAIMATASGTALPGENEISINEQNNQLLAVLAAGVLGVNKKYILDAIKANLITTRNILDCIDGSASGLNAVVRYLVGAPNIVFNAVNGKILVSQFSRGGILNKLVKLANGNVGVATKYSAAGLSEVPVLNTLFYTDKVTNVISKGLVGVAAVINGATVAVDAVNKTTAVWNDSSATTEDKIYDTAAIASTSAIGMALNVGAPIAGAAVGAACSAIPVAGPVIGIVAGTAVNSSLMFASDVVTSEAVVSQVSESYRNIGDAVKTGYAEVNNAVGELSRSENAGDAVANAAKLAGTVTGAVGRVVVTDAVEAAKTVGAVAVEAGTRICDGAAGCAKAVAGWFK